MLLLGALNTHSHNVSMHKFPKDPELRLKWEKQVQRTRDKWSATENSVLCSNHFEADCYEVDSMLAEQMGMKKRKRFMAAINVVILTPVHSSR